MRHWKPIGLTLATALVVAACSQTPAGQGNASSDPSTAPSSNSASPAATDDMGGMSHSPEASESGAPSGDESGAIDTDAANLRVDLDYLLGEHIILASKATGAALAGRNDQFAAYGELLNTNGTELGAMIGAAYGPDAEDSFNEIWSAHNGFFVDYTTGVASDDQAMQDQAVEDLTTIYVPQFSELIAGATGLPQDAVADLTTEHVLQTKAVVDAQASGDFEAAYDAIRVAYSHMQMIGDAIAPAIVEGNAEAFAGDPATAGVDFRVALNQLLQEHLFLASFATDAALDGREDEFAAAGAALNTNGTDLGAAIGGLYGTEAEDQFNEIWSAHNGFFVDYTTGVATDDMAMQDQAVEDLTTVYVPQFSEFLAGATGLPEADLADLITDHVLTTKAIVDAQGADDFAAAAEADREAAQHMKMLGDPLASAIVEALPEKFSE